MTTFPNERASGPPPSRSAPGAGPADPRLGPGTAPALYAEARALAVLCRCGHALASHRVTGAGRVHECSLYLGPRGVKCGCGGFEAAP